MKEDLIEVTLVQLIEKPEKSLGPEWKKESTEILRETGVVAVATNDENDPKRD